MAKQKYGIIGHPVTHSLSPAMQNAAFAASGIDASYEIFDVEPGDLEAFLTNAADNGISGLNVTIPHKIKAKEYIEKKGMLDGNAERLGAVNTVKVIDGALNGFNTDGPGFYRSLIEDLKFEPEGKNILVLGTGGAATAIIMYLGNSPRTIFVTDIDMKRCEDLKTHYRKYFDEKRLRVVETFGLGDAVKECQLLVNATPVGMKEEDGLPLDKDLLHPGLYVYDLVYNRRETELVKEANRMKLHAVTGLGMLLYQGAIAFEIWTEKKPPVDVMRKALKEAIRAGG
ncbi:MAG: shikimate dehydrogenase [Candidatus Omnitrophica bacterium]|nr:shikimate dehydrogenase [Candidatus Omnitrophota bacterium]